MKNLILVAALFACSAKKSDTPDPSAEVPVESGSESKEETKTEEGKTEEMPTKKTEKPQMSAEQLKECIADCVKSRQMEARAIEAIEADCENSCRERANLPKIDPGLSPLPK